MLQEYTQHKYTHRIKQSINNIFDAFLERQGTLAYVPITLVIISMFCGASWLIFWSATDPARYQCYALTFWLGSHAAHLLPTNQCSFLQDFYHSTKELPPFHMLPIEYPPLTLIPFSLALLVPIAYYQLAFAMLMSLVAVLIYWLLLHYGPRGSAVIFAIYLFIGAISTADVRFDLIPSALTLLCIVAAERRHWTSAYVALAFGVLIKLYPLLLLPALFIAEQQSEGRLHIPLKSLSLKTVAHELLYTLLGTSRWKWKNCLIFIGIVLGVTGGFALLNFQGAIVSQINYFLQRQPQVETTNSTILWLASYLGSPQKVVYAFGSFNSVSQLSGIVSSLGTGLFITGTIYVLWLQWRDKIDIAQASIALLLLFIATGKVFSPQYLIWLMPLLAYVGAINLFWSLTWGAVSLITTFIYIFLYSHITSPDPNLLTSIYGFFETVGARNAFFELITLAYLFNWFQARQRRPLPVAANQTR